MVVSKFLPPARRRDFILEPRHRALGREEQPHRETTRQAPTTALAGELTGANMPRSSAITRSAAVAAAWCCPTDVFPCASTMLRACVSTTLASLPANSSAVTTDAAVANRRRRFAGVGFMKALPIRPRPPQTW